MNFGVSTKMALTKREDYIMENNSSQTVAVIHVE